MASHVVVIDSSFRRANVKVTHQTHLSDVLEQACQKLGLRSEQYGIKHNKKQLDLSLTYRLSGLHSGAQLELVQVSRSPSVVNIALHLPNNKRLTDKFPSSTTLWQILRRFESGAAGDTGPDAINITQRGIASTGANGTGAGRLFYEMPVINVMNRQLASFVDLQKTLAQIGITNGSHLLRLQYKNEGQPLEEAMQQISLYFKDAEESKPTAEAQGAQASAAGQLQSDPAPEPVIESAEPEPEPEPMEGVTPSAEATVIPEQQSPATNSTPVDAETSTAPSNSANPSRRSLTVFTAPTSSTPAAAARPHNDSDFEPTIEQARHHLSRLGKQTQNQRLLSDAELAKKEEEKQAQISQVQKVRVRVKLPDQTLVQDTFGREDTAADLFGVVRLALRHPEQPFVLKYADSKNKHVPLTEGPQTLIKNLGWTGSQLVYMLWGDGVGDDIKRAPSLNDELIKQAEALKVEEPAVEEEPEKEKKGLLGGMLGKSDGKKKSTLSGSAKESKLKGMLFGKKK